MSPFDLTAATLAAAASSTTLDQAVVVDVTRDALSAIQSRRAAEDRNEWRRRRAVAILTALDERDSVELWRLDVRESGPENLIRASFETTAGLLRGI